MTKREQRANAQRTLNAYKEGEGLDTGEDIVTLVDLVTDCLHLADTLKYESGQHGGAQHVLESALNHYNAEKGYSDDQEQHA